MGKSNLKFEFWDVKEKEMEVHADLVKFGFSYAELTTPNKNIIVREWTGYLDSAKKELYSDDIVEYEYKVRGKVHVCRTVIIWRNGWVLEDNYHKLVAHAFLPAGSKTVTKIGNIYQSPELMEGVRNGIVSPV